MPDIEEHCRRCREVLGEEFAEVHLWLDELFGRPPWGANHRHLRHHLGGVAEVRRRWGERAARAAELHIRQDLDQEGWPADKPLPRDAAEYLEPRGLEIKVRVDPDEDQGID